MKHVKYNRLPSKMFSIRAAAAVGLTAVLLIFSNHGCTQVPINVPQPQNEQQVGSGEAQDEEREVRVPRKYTGHWDLSFHMVFPQGDFRSTDPGISGAGNALQGAGGSVGRYIPFKAGSNLGAYMSLGYFSNRIRGLAESLNETLDAVDGDEILRINDFNPRYEVMPASAGIAYESNFEKVNVYARLLLNLSASYINRFSYRIDGTQEAGMFFPFDWNTGYTVELGLNIGKEFNLGMAWNHFGTVEFSPSPTLQNSDLPGVEALENLTFQRRIQTLEVKLGYTFRHRDNL